MKIDKLGASLGTLSLKFQGRLSTNKSFHHLFAEVCGLSGFRRTNQVLPVQGLYSLRKSKCDNCLARGAVVGRIVQKALDSECQGSCILRAAPGDRMISLGTSAGETDMVVNAIIVLCFVYSINRRSSKSEESEHSWLSDSESSEDSQSSREPGKLPFGRIAFVSGISGGRGA